MMRCHFSRAKKDYCSIDLDGVLSPGLCGEILAMLKKDYCSIDLDGVLSPGLCGEILAMLKKDSCLFW